MVVGETTILTGKFVGETHRVLECVQTHPPRNQHTKGQICLWVAEEITGSQPRPEQVTLFLLSPLPHIQCHNAVTWLPYLGEYLRLHPLQRSSCAKTKKYGSSERTDQNSKNRSFVPPAKVEA